MGAFSFRTACGGVVVLAVAVCLIAAGGPQRFEAAPDTRDDPIPTDRIRVWVDAWKQDPRGPYAGIRWFCPDGRVIPAQARCDTPGGIQHAVPKPEVQALRERNGLYVGQILAGTDKVAFWDAADRHSRLKQYQLGTYLYAADDGWILRRAQYYRGAFQAEDEARWARSFLHQMLRDEERVRSHFYLLREAARDLPLGGDGNIQQRIRATAEDLADTEPAFMPLRVKIHSQPGPTDLEQVRVFRRTHGDTLGAPGRTLLRQLEQDLSAVYETSGADRLARPAASLPDGQAPARAAQDLIAAWPSLGAGERIRRSADLLLRLRGAITSTPPEHRLALLELSLALEAEVLRGATAWTPATPKALLEKGAVLARAAAGSGYIEHWEWERAAPRLEPLAGSSVSLDAFARRAEAVRRVAEWGTAMATAHYQHVVDHYATFEPKARAFIDDRVRNTVLLPLGQVASQLGREAATYAGRQHHVMDLADTGRLRGITPGVAVGTLHVVTDAARAVAFDKDDIYAVAQPPVDLSPVAGLVTATEGNVVSHVQLLARNLGIPTAAFTDDQMAALARHDGRRVFLAVSPEGTVRMKPAARMTADERALVGASSAGADPTLVATDTVDLSETDLLPLRTLRASDAGRVVGPKAANLGQLKALFPDRVAPGLAIPFGVFRAHMAQPMPGTVGSYWDYLEATFARTETTRGDVPPRVRRRLDTLRAAIREMPLKPAFRTALGARFQAVFGAPMGTVGVFLRSDTNMEDLPTFTGAGLNLTVPNVTGTDDLFDAIRRVWASPYTERSYRWRQRVLATPEQVYPSVLLMKNVPADKSGVLITTGVSTGAPGAPGALTASFSRGVGGAVQGEATEVTVLRPNGEDVLLAPLRTPTITVLPPEGGTATRATPFHRPVLTAANRDALRRLARALRQRLPAIPSMTSGPYDVEVGFRDGHVWLFQVRPFVEADRSRFTAYFRRLDAQAAPQSTVDLTAPLDD